MRKMTVRERMMAVINNCEHDEVPFVQYDNLIAPNEILWDFFGKDTLGVLQRSNLTKYENKKCRIVKEDYFKNNFKGFKNTMYTPKGTLTEKILYDPVLKSPHREEHFIKEIKDYDILLEYFEDLIVCEDTHSYISHDKYVGEAGLPMVCTSRTPFQQMWIHWVNLEDLCLHLVDIPDVIEKCFTVLRDLQKKQLETIRRASDNIPFHIVNFPDNITAPVIGEKYFRKYCLPMYNEAAAMMEGKNILITVHTDGDLKPLHKAIGESRIGGLDSFTPKPDTDTTVEEAIRIWPNMKLFINYPSSLHLEDPEVIHENAQKILTESSRTGRLWIQISENVPPEIWKKSFPCIIKAIREYGAPLSKS